MRPSFSIPSYGPVTYTYTYAYPQNTGLSPVNSGDFKVYVGEQANIESDFRLAAFDVPKKALSEIKRRLKESTKDGKARKPAKPRLCAHCQSTLAA